LVGVDVLCILCQRLVDNLGSAVALIVIAASLLGCGLAILALRSLSSLLPLLRGLVVLLHKLLEVPRLYVIGRILPLPLAVGADIGTLCLLRILRRALLRCRRILYFLVQFLGGFITVGILLLPLVRFAFLLVFAG